MIIVTTLSGKKEGILLHNFVSCNSPTDGENWVASWNGEKVHRQKVQDTVEELQLKVYIARHGKLPPKGILS